MWAICTRHISSLTAPGLVDWSKKVHISLKKNLPAELSGYGPVKIKYMAMQLQLLHYGISDCLIIPQRSSEQNFVIC